MTGTKAATMEEAKDVEHAAKGVIGMEFPKLDSADNCVYKGTCAV